MGLRVEWRGSNDRDVRWLRWLRCWSGGEAALSRTRRLAWTLVSGLLLSSLVGAYVGLISPWLEVPRRARPSSSAAADLPSGPPPENAIIAGRYLPEWALSARWQGRWGQTYFFAGRQEAIEEDAMVRFAPFALVHLPAPDAGAQPKTSQREPVVILADSAVVHFPDSVDLDDPDPRLAVGCRFDGAVEVRGADGLTIRGGNFLFDREAMLVASNDPVQLAWSGHSGRADGVELQLGDPGGDSAASAPSGLPSGPVRAVRLLSHVELKMAPPHRSEGVALTAPSRPWRIECEGPMVVDPVSLVATFSDSVEVHRPAEANSWDSLKCQQLELRFRRRVGGPRGRTGPAGGQALEFVRLEAAGAPVQVGSSAHDLEARADWLAYRADRGTIELQGNVTARWQRGRLVSQHVLLSRGSDGRIERAVCRGAGTMSWQQPGTPPVPVRADWSKRMTLSPEPGTDQDLVVLEGKPLIRYRAQSVLGAESIRIWLAREGGSSGPGTPGRSARITRLIAREEVGVLTPTAFVKTSLLDVTFESIKSRKELRAGVRRPGATSLLPKRPHRLPPGEVANRVQIRAESIRGRLGVPRDGGEWVVREVVTEGRVRMSRPPRGMDEAVEVTGERLRLVETADDGHGVSIVGRPARLRLGRREMSGSTIKLDSTSGRGSIDGSGTLKMPADRLLSGDPAPPGTHLQVRWDEKLVLDGRTFSFLGDVKSELADSRVDCEQLDVTLDRAPDLSIDGRGRYDVELQTLRFRHSVRLTRYVFEQVSESTVQPSRVGAPRRRLAEVLKARMANLLVDMTTRDTSADGPGWIQSWQRGRRRHGPLAPTALARANLPLELDEADWQYLRIDFAKSSRANIDLGFATFDDQVQVITGHVSRPGDIVDPDRLGRDAGWMQCDSLQVTREAVVGRATDAREGHPAAESNVVPVEGSVAAGPRRSLTMLARGDATGAGRMSGQSWYGRAETISFNEASGWVVLSSLGSQTATLWRRKAESGPYSRVDAQRLLMSLTTGEVVLDRASATQLVPEGR
jgi:hypothetical protein